MGKLDGQVAVITGGASGIGAATRSPCSPQRGPGLWWRICRRTRARRWRKKLGDQGAFVQVNVTREAEVKAAIEAAVERWGRLDCIYNNAGFGGALRAD